MTTPRRATPIPAAAIQPERLPRSMTPIEGRVVAAPPPTAAPHSRQNCAPATTGRPHWPQFRAVSAEPQALQNLPLAAAPQAGHVVMGPDVT